MNNEEVPCFYADANRTIQSDTSQHVRKEIDDWLKEGNKKLLYQLRRII